MSFVDLCMQVGYTLYRWHIRGLRAKPPEFFDLSDSLQNMHCVSKRIPDNLSKHCLV